MKLRLLLNNSIKPITTSLFIVLLWSSSSTHAALKVEVTEGVSGRVPIAVLPFVAPSGSKRNFGDIIAGDLAYSGLFSIISTADAKPVGLGGAIDYAHWLALGVEKLIFGTVTKEDDQWRVRVELHDVAARVRLLGREVNSPSFDYAAHYISDNIYQELTGIKGIFRTRLAFVTSERHGWRAYKFFLYVSDADGHNAVSVFTSQEQLMSPVWSPDMKKLAYVSYESGQPEIIIQTLASAKRVNLGEHIGAAVSPDWSADGAYLAYVSSQHGNPDVYTLRLHDMQIKRVTDHVAIDTEPSYMPDGTVIFTSDRSNGPQLYQSRPGNASPRRLTFNGPYNSDADVLADGTKISFLSRRKKGFAIVLQDLASGDETALAYDRDLERPRFAANGQLLGYLAGGKVVMLTVDGRFGKPVRVMVPGNIRSVSWSPLMQ